MWRLCRGWSMVASTAVTGCVAGGCIFDPDRTGWVDPQRDGVALTELADATDLDGEVGRSGGAGALNAGADKGCAGDQTVEAVARYVSPHPAGALAAGQFEVFGPDGHLTGGSDRPRQSCGTGQPQRPT